MKSYQPDRSCYDFTFDPGLDIKLTGDPIGFSYGPEFSDQR